LTRPFDMTFWYGWLSIVAERHLLQMHFKKRWYGRVYFAYWSFFARFYDFDDDTVLAGFNFNY
jgi:hypothetical protein